MKKGFFGNDNETKEKALVVLMYVLVAIMLIAIGMLTMILTKFNVVLFAFMLLTSSLSIYICIASRALYLTRTKNN